MENRINVAELLKYCPKGMELDSTMYDNLYFDRVEENYRLPISCYTIYHGSETPVFFTEFGNYNEHETTRCVIFPKGKKTWEGFVPPCKFKNGDVIYNQCIKAVAIFNKQTDKATISHCYLNIRGELLINHWHCKNLFDWKLATEEEKQKLFNAIKASGYKWNPETKTLEGLIIPKFKVGDRIKHIVGREEFATIISVKELHYNLDSKVGTSAFSISLQHEWELVPNKFDINTLKPFDKVLVRGDVGQRWIIDFFGFMDNNKGFPFVCVGHYVTQCIPYEGNEHLLGTTEDCEDRYKLWLS